MWLSLVDEILNEILRSHWVNEKEIAGILWKPLFEVMIPLILWDIPLVTLYTGGMSHHSPKATMGHPIGHSYTQVGCPITASRLLWAIPLGTLYVSGMSHDSTKATMGHPIGHFIHRWDVPSQLQGYCGTSH